MSGGPVSVSGPHPPIGTTPRLAPKARHSRRVDPRRGSHRKPVRVFLPPPPHPEVQEPGCPQSAPTTDRSRTASGLRASHSQFHPKRAEPGVSVKPPPKQTADKSRTISGQGPLPRHSIRSGRKTGGSGKGRKRREKEERRGGEKSGSWKVGKPEGREKQGSRKAGKSKSREVKKSGSRKAGKRAEALKGIKKRRRTVGCTSACGSQRSLAYRNYLLR